MGKHFCLNDDDDDDEGKSQSHVGDVGPSFSSLYTQLTEHKELLFCKKSIYSYGYLLLKGSCTKTNPQKREKTAHHFCLSEKTTLFYFTANNQVCILLT